MYNFQDFSMSNSQKKKKWYYRLRDKYRLVIMNEDTYEEKFSFSLSRINVFVALSTTVIVLIVLTIFIIAFTPLREYIPGYMDPTLPAKVYSLNLKADSLENDLRLKNMYLQNIRNIIEGREIVEKPSPETVEEVNYDTITLKISREDSILRAEFESQTKYNLYLNGNNELYRNNIEIARQPFFTPLKGIITNQFNLANGHYGVDIVAKSNEAIKAVMDGTIIFADWTLKTGYVIGIQHLGNFISIYKHNAILLKKQGNFVKAGDPIAIIGDSGELSTGPHLHFELWYNGTPVNPEEYMSF